MTPAQILAVVLLLQAFGVNASTVSIIKAQLQPKVATSTVQVVAPVQTPPQTFGSVSTPVSTPPPVQNTTPQATPVVQSVPMKGITFSSTNVASSTTISVVGDTGPAANVAITIFDQPYGHEIVNDTTDGNGQFVFNIRDKGTHQYIVKVDSLNLSQKVTIVVNGE